MKTINVASKAPGRATETSKLEVSFNLSYGFSFFFGYTMAVFVCFFLIILIELFSLTS